MIKALNQIKELVEKIDQEEKTIGPSVTELNQFEKTFNNVKKLIDLQSQLKKVEAAPMSEQQIVDSFTKWLSDNGCKDAFDKVKIVRGLNEGSGLVAASDIGEGSEFISVPSKLFMTQETAIKAFGEKVIREPLFRYIPSLLLTVFLIQEQLNMPKSFWTPYIRMLPRTYRTVLQFTMEDFRALNGSSVMEEAISTYRNTLRQYCFLYDFFNKNPGIIATSSFTWDTFTWAVSTIMSRQNQIPWGTITFPNVRDQAVAAIFQSAHKHQMSLIPFWDLCNHLVEGKITTFYEQDRKALTCSAVRSFTKGEQVLIHYGDRPNSQLLLYSGFCVQDNPYDTTKIKLNLPTGGDQKVHHDKLHILEERGMAASMNIVLEKKPSQSLPDPLIPFFRVIALTKDELASIAPQYDSQHDHAPQDPAYFRPHLTEAAFEIMSENNEAAAYKWAMEYLRKRLNSYQTTIAYDEEALSKNPSDWNKYLLYLRLSEKKIIQQYIDTLQEYVKNGVMNANLPKNVAPQPSPQAAHGHSHGGQPCHGHGGESHGHSHGGSGGDHGHSHGGKPKQQHGHSHGGQPCHGHGGESHGHSHGSGDHGHSHGGSDEHHGHSH